MQVDLERIYNITHRAHRICAKLSDDVPVEQKADFSHLEGLLEGLLEFIRLPNPEETEEEPRGIGKWLGR